MMLYRRSRQFITLFVLLMMLMCVQDASAPNVQAHANASETVGTITPFDCPMTPAGYDVECGWLTVPEDHTQPRGATIRIAFARYFASDDATQPDPVVLLNGGPGYGAIDAINPANAVTMTPDRDFIVVDQRGIGLSQPTLVCPEVPEDVRQRLKVGTFRFGALEFMPDEGVRACHERLMADGVNLQAYNTTNNAHDLDLLREALGYEQWNISGVSYGTLLGLVLMREHGEHIRSAVLDAVIPPSINPSINQPWLTYSMLERFLTACAENELCQRAYPDLPQSLYNVLVRLASNPIQIGMKLDGETIIMPFDDRSLMDYIFNQLYSDATFRDLPATIDLLDGDDARLLTRTVPAIINSILYDNIAHGTYLSVICQEQALPADYERDIMALHPAVRNAMLDDVGVYVAPLDSACVIWDLLPVDEAFREPVVSEIPTLLLSGALDPVTPPDFAIDTAQYLANSTTVVFPGRGHSVSRTDCAPQLITAFLNEPTAPLDLTCLAEAQPPFFSIPRQIVDAALADAIEEASAQLEERTEDGVGLALGVPVQWERTETSNGNPQYTFEEASLTLYRKHGTTLGDAIDAYATENTLRRAPRIRDSFTVGDALWTRYNHLEAGMLWSIVATLDDDAVVLVVMSAPATNFPEVAWEAMLDTLVLTE
jgi:pimeloyl-ACP methyl ester carboxylesterase